MTDQQTKDMRERFEQAVYEWKAHGEWQFADREAAWKFMFEAGWQAALSTAPPAKDSLPVADEAVAYRCRDPSIIGGGVWHYVGKDEYLIAEGFEVELLYTRPAPLPSVPVEALKLSVKLLDMHILQLAVMQRMGQAKAADVPGLEAKLKDLTTFLSQLGEKP
jgi:hypothetical protein